MPYDVVLVILIDLDALCREVTLCIRGIAAVIDGASFDAGVAPCVGAESLLGLERAG